MIRKVRLGVLFCLLILFLLYPVSSFSANPSHHVYLGIFTGGDSSNPAAGGWDNEGSYDAAGYYNGPYSVDRDMVTWQGKNFSVEQTYMAPDVAPSSLANITYQELELIWYYGRVPMVNLTYSSWTNCQKTMVQLMDELNDSSSASYEGLVLWAQGLKNWLDLGKNDSGAKRFLILAFLQEANHNLCAVEAVPSTWDFVDPDAYKAAFRKGRQIIESVLGPDASSRVQWMFAPVMVSNYWMPDFESYYPGDDVVDWMGLSAYNTGGFSISGWTFPWQTFDGMARPYLDRIRRLAPRKPLALAQVGSISFEGDKNAWLKEFFAEAVKYPKLYLIIYFNMVVKGEAGMPTGLDWPVFWNDPYDATSYGYNVYLPQMRYSGWLNAIQQNPNLVFSPISMPPAGAFTAVNWNIAGGIAPVSNQYDLLPELRARDDDFDGDGVSNWEELASGLDPQVADRETTETDCYDGIDNDANKRTDLDDTSACGDITLAEGDTRNDFTLAPASVTEKRYFQFTVPPGSTSSTISIENLTGDVDLYVRRADRPATVLYDYKSDNPGQAEESVTINSPAAGVWHIMVNGVQKSVYQIRVNTSCIVNPSVSSAVSVIACDMDNNGQDDIIFLTEGSGVRVYANAGSWLNLQTGQGDPTLIACGDFDGNGIKEIIGAFAASHSLKFFSRESWTWSDLSVVSEIPGSMVAKDIDNDGKAEIIGLFTSANAIKLRRGSTGKWETIPLGGYPLPDEVLVAELAENPDREILGVWRGLNQIRFYNFFTASWNSVAMPAGYGSVPDLVSIGDIDSDGISDIVGVWNGAPYSVQIRVGFNGDWKEILSGTVPDSVPDVIDVADADADQKDDVFMVWNAWKQIWIYVQQWKGAKLIYQGPPPAFVVSGNFDGDSAGRKDFAGIWQDGTFKIWMNNSKFLDMTKFSDVPLVHWAYPYIDNFADQGITSGCKQDDPLTPENESEFCPDGFVTRAQMAIFLTKALNEMAGVCKGTVFNDVNALTVGDGFCKYIEKFSTMGITAGCGNGNYCPNDLVSRAQMAVFITKSLGEMPAASCTGKLFSDVNTGTVGDVFCKYIEKFSTQGITSGCGNGNFCPDAYVTRAQMAVFLTKAFLQ